MTVACEQALHLGDIVKSKRASGTRGETRREGDAGNMCPEKTSGNSGNRATSKKLSPDGQCYKVDGLPT